MEISKLISINLSGFVGELRQAPDWHHKLHCFMVAHDTIIMLSYRLRSKKFFFVFLLIDFRQTLLVFKLVYRLHSVLPLLLLFFFVFTFVCRFFCFSSFFLLWGSSFHFQYPAFQLAEWINNNVANIEFIKNNKNHDEQTAEANVVFSFISSCLAFEGHERNRQTDELGRLLKWWPHIAVFIGKRKLLFRCEMIR